MLTINVNFDRAIAKLDNADKKQIPFAAKNTLNELAYEIAREELPAEARKIFEGGATSWTQRAFRFRKATKRKLYAIVYLRDDTHDYLAFQIDGGIRLPNKKKILIPTDNIRLNKFGNITKGKRQTLFDNDKKYFIGVPHGMKGERNFGIWERYPTTKKKTKSQKIRMVAKLTDRAKYKKKLKFYKVARLHVRRTADTKFDKHMKRAKATAR